MTTSKHSEAQMINALKKTEAGQRAEDRRASTGSASRQSIPGIRKMVAWMRPRRQQAHQLRDENTRLRKLAANLSPDRQTQ